jgi:hypothetical protein
MQHAAALTVLAEAYVVARDTDAASAAAARARAVARAHGQRGEEAAALHALAQATVRDVGDAEAGYLSTIALASELEMAPLIARATLGLGRLYLGVGDRKRAAARLAAATRLFGTLDMPLWLTRALTAAAPLGGVVTVGRRHVAVYEALRRTLGPHHRRSVVLADDDGPAEGVTFAPGA